MRTPDDGVLHLWRRTACLPVVKRARRLTGRQEGETRATLFIWREARVGFLKRKVTTLQIVRSSTIWNRYSRTNFLEASVGK